MSDMRILKKIAIWALFVSFISLAVFGFLGLAFTAGFAQCAASVIPGVSGCAQLPQHQAEIFHAFSLAILTAVLLLAAVFAAFGGLGGEALKLLNRVLSAVPVVLGHARSFSRRQLEWLAFNQRVDYLA